LRDYYYHNFSWLDVSPKGIAPSPRVDHSMSVVETAHGANIVIFGGFDGQEALRDFHVLVTLTWSQVNQEGQGPTPRIGHTMTVVS
jgi:hypothetical protein